MNPPQVDRSPTPKRDRAGQEARPREPQGEPVPEALRIPGQCMEEVSQAVVLRLDGQTKIAPSPSDSERKRCRRVRMQGSEGVSHSDGCRLRSSMTSPLAEDGSPDWDSQDFWVGPGLSPLDPSSVPDDRESLHSWASSRADAHFDRCWESAIADWESSPNKVGSADDIDKQEGRDMVEAAINLHLDEVQSCMDSGGGPTLDDWRSGTREAGLLPMVSLVNGASLTQQQGAAQ